MNFINPAFHIEGLLWDRIKFAIEDHLETLHGLLSRHKFSGDTCEGLSDEEWLREELLNLACALHSLLIIFGELFHSKDRDDVLELLVALKNFLHSTRGVVVLFPYDFRCE